MYNDLYIRHPWDNAKQAELGRSKVLLIGTGKAAEDILLQLVALGIGTSEQGHIRIIGKDGPDPKDNFLDMRFRIGETKVKQLEEFCKNINPDVHVVSRYAEFDTVAMHSTGDYDVIIDSTNDYISKRIALEYAKQRKKPFISLSCSPSKGCLNVYDPEKNEEKDIFFYEYLGKEQGLIISGILAGVAVEETKNRLIKNKNYFLEQRVFYNMSSKTRTDDIDYYDIGSKLGSFPNKKVLLVGAGGIGSFTVDWLTKMNANFDIVDFDKVVSHNLNRQIRFYKSVGKYKSSELARMCSNFNNYANIRGIVGIVAKQWDDHLIKKIFKNTISVDKAYNPNIEDKLKSISGKVEQLENLGSNYSIFLGAIRQFAKQEYRDKKLDDYLESLPIVQLVNYDYIKKQRYDLIIDNLDNLVTRRYLHIVSQKLQTPFIGCGTNTMGADVIPYYPGLTSCPECQCPIEQQAAKEDLRSRRSCIQAPPSVIMSNFICTHLLADVVRTFLGFETYGKPINKTFKYSIKGYTVLNLSKEHDLSKCNHEIDYGRSL